MKNRLWLLTLMSLGLASCRTGEVDKPTLAAAAPTVTDTVAVPPPSEQSPLPSTWTPPPLVDYLTPTSANLPSRTPQPTNTAWPTNTATSTVTRTPAPTPTNDATPTVISPAPLPVGTNLLSNPSFEGGWYHVNGIPEMQVPNLWRLEWDTGRNPLDSDPWNRFVRPESRVLSRDFLPRSEHDLFIWDGEQTVKVFKRQGAISFRLVKSIRLDAGSYVFEINVFPDMIDSYTDSGSKIWAPDPLSGELQFIVGIPASSWISPTFGKRNTLSYAFEVTSPRTMRLGVAFRGRWAILNNGWFMDDWSLRQLSQSASG